MSELVRADEKDVERRWLARSWLTDAILRAQDQSIPVGPAVDLLSALEALDVVEVIRIDSRGSEEILSVNAAGPFVVQPQEDGVFIRIAGKTDPMLSLPKPNRQLLAAKKGQSQRTPSELGIIAFKLAAVERLIELGQKPKMAIAKVEKHLGPVENARKKFKSNRDPLLREDFERAAKCLAIESVEEVLSGVVRIASFLGRK